MKKQKLNLDDLKVKSFVVEEEAKRKVKGGFEGGDGGWATGGALCSMLFYC